MDGKKIGILLIEDNPGDARLVRLMLADEFGDGFILQQADRLSAGLKKLFESETDVVLLDLTLPDSQELHTLNWVQIQSKGAPVIVLTGIDDEKLAVETVKLGAQDYLVKGHFDSKALARSIRYAVERQRLTGELLKVQDDLEQAKLLSEIGTLAATVAHKLRTPLAAISMAAFNIRSKIQDKSLGSHFGTIEKKVLECDKIVSNLLYYSGHLKEPHRKKVKIHSIINGCLDETKRRHPEQEVFIDKRYGASEDLSVEADETLLKELFINVFDNAYEALTNKGGRIDVSTDHEKDGGVKISVKDSGEGISSENLQKVFSPFFTTKVSGIGLGLAICMQIVRLHKGAMTINSVKDEGAMVTIVLPATLGSV